jgi:hypothetical protein
MEIRDKLTQSFQEHFGDDPGFAIDFDPSPPDRVTGTLTLEVFNGKKEYERQNMIWDVLDEELTDDERFMITIIIANTPRETAMFQAQQRGGDARGR